MAMGQSTPVGYWKTIDDETNKEKAIVQIYSEGETLSGKIVYIYPSPDKPANPLCERCSGEFKNKPVLGMRIMWSLKKSDSDAKWDSGEILDPNNGKIYSSKIELSNQGNDLKVRGFLGFSLLGRTQTWKRWDKATP